MWGCARSSQAFKWLTYPSWRPPMFLKHFYNRHGRHPDTFTLSMNRLECINQCYADWLHLCRKTVRSRLVYLPFFGRIDVAVLPFSPLNQTVWGRDFFSARPSMGGDLSSRQPCWLPLLMLTTPLIFHFPSHAVRQTVFCTQTTMHKGWSFHQLNVMMAHHCECYCAASVSRLARTSNTEFY